MKTKKQIALKALKTIQKEFRESKNKRLTIKKNYQKKLIPIDKLAKKIRN